MYISKFFTPYKQIKINDKCFAFKIESCFFMLFLCLPYQHGFILLCACLAVITVCCRRNFMGQLIVSSTLSEKKKKKCVCFVRKESILGDSEREKSLMFLSFSLPANFFSLFFPLSQPMSSVPQFRIASLCVFCTHTRCNIPLLRAL